MQSEIQNQVQSLVAEKIESEQTQKTNLEEKSHNKHHHVSNANIQHQYLVAHWNTVAIFQFIIIFSFV